MSRSYKKIKIRGITTATSEKKDKRAANRKLRRIIKQKNILEETVLPKLREISNVWAFDKDGKIYDAEMIEKELRK
ncbi:hypothetical protein KORDIASMS9_01747 [Kordia sp. SMS9]|uniref:hypothetical protein n=1 Tax=Kordia sp. SMS9 TaxID=2282170 RepID=UPI000E0D96FA|nr:hypothetical protein [Kordia sp. SMS9]AXG69524.1 hypothetical protein KORDIASMS9_01747 [Kordia sp. SMS9]